MDTLTGEVSTRPAKTARLRLLVVDDDPEIAAFMRMKLGKDAPHLDISVAGSGLECLERLAVDGVDCILSDYQMPGMNGMELLSEIRGRGIKVPFIFVTGQGSEEVAREAFKGGAYDYFTKDIGFAHFARIINSVEQAVRQRLAEESKSKVEEALKDAAAGVSAETGESFFKSLVSYMARSLGVKFAFVGVLTGPGSRVVRTLSVYAGGTFADNFEYDLHGTPCENVVGKELCAYVSRVRERFPEDLMLGEMGIESYAGIPLFDSYGGALGLLSVMDGKPMEDVEVAGSLLTIFASRAGAEVQRMRVEDELVESERRFRDLIEDVRLASVILEADGRVSFANEFLLRLTGYKAEEVIGRNWFDTFVPEDERAGVRRYFEEIIRKGAMPPHHVNGILTKSGQKRLVAWSNTVLRDRAGNITGTASIGEDLSEHQTH